MPQATIHVPPRPYQAWIENGLLTRAGSVLSELLPQASRIFIVTVPPVRKRWGSKLVTSLKASGFTPQVIPMPDGEPTNPAFEKRCERFFQEFEWYARALREAREKGVPY